MENKISFNVGEKVKRKDNGLTYIVTGSNMAFGQISTVFLDGECFGVSPKMLEKLDGSSLSRSEIEARLNDKVFLLTEYDNVILDGEFSLKELAEIIRLLNLLKKA